VNGLVYINVGMMSPRAVKLFDATERRAEEVFNEGGELDLVRDLAPLIVGQCRHLWPRMSSKRTMALCSEVWEAYRRALALAAQPAAGEG